jgi:hypothetical protein
MNCPNDQIPSLENCWDLHLAGLRPPKGQSIGYAYKFNTNTEIFYRFPYSGGLDKDGTRFIGGENSGLGILIFGQKYKDETILFFAPNSGQLIELLFDAQALPTKIPKKGRADFLAKKVWELLKK